MFGINCGFRCWFLLTRAETELRECRPLNREVDVDTGAAGSHFVPHDIT